MSLAAWDAIDGQTGSVEDFDRLASLPIHFVTYLPDRKYAIDPTTDGFREVIFRAPLTNGIGRFFSAIYWSFVYQQFNGADHDAVTQI